MLSAHEQVKVEQEEDDKRREESQCKDINLVSSGLSDAGDFGEAILLFDVMNRCLSDHTLNSLTCEQVNLEFTDLNALFFIDAFLDCVPELLGRIHIAVQEKRKAMTSPSVQSFQIIIGYQVIRIRNRGIYRDP